MNNNLRFKIYGTRLTTLPFSRKSKIESRKSNRALAPLLLILLFFSNFLFLSCSSEDETLSKKEKKAESILKKADNLWRRGKEINALKVYKQLYLKFPETAARKTAENILLKKGISIESALISWTSQRMVKLENTVLAYRDNKGGYPKGRGVKHPLDAWGNEIYFRLFPDKKKYDFIVFSNGPDKIKSTEDDILVIHTMTESEKSAPKKGTGGIVSLDELKSLSNNSEDTSESTLSLEQLKGAAGDKGYDQGSKDKMSLEQLRNFAKDN